MRDRARWPQRIRRFLVCLIVISSLSWLAVPDRATPPVNAALVFRAIARRLGRLGS